MSPPTSSGRRGRPAEGGRCRARPSDARRDRRAARRLGASGLRDAGRALVREKRCGQCHTGLGDEEPTAIDIPIRSAAAGCPSGRSIPRFTIDAPTRAALADYLASAPLETHPSPFETRQRLLERRGCFRCHRRDSDLPSPLEEISGRVFEHDLQCLPGQRTPRLSYALSKYLRSYLLASVRGGVAGVRPPWYSYRMPAYGEEAARLVQALAEGDGDLVTGADPPVRRAADPEFPAAGPSLVGSAGYSCVACHVWNGQNLTEPEPGSAGPELMTVGSRIRRDYFDRWLDDPRASTPRTPMPQIFRKGQPAMLAGVLDGDPRPSEGSRSGPTSSWARAAPSPVSLPPDAHPRAGRGAAGPGRADPHSPRRPHRGGIDLRPERHARPLAL